MYQKLVCVNLVCFSIARLLPAALLWAWDTDQNSQPLFLRGCSCSYSPQPPTTPRAAVRKGPWIPTFPTKCLSFSSFLILHQSDRCIVSQTAFLWWSLSLSISSHVGQPLVHSTDHRLFTCLPIFLTGVVLLSVCWRSLDIPAGLRHCIYSFETILEAFSIISEIYPFGLGIQIHKCRVVNGTFIF